MRCSSFNFIVSAPSSDRIAFYHIGSAAVTSVFARCRFPLTIRTLHATGAVWIKDKGICNVRRDGGAYVVVRIVNTCRHVLSISCKIKAHSCSSRSRSTRKLFPWPEPEPLTSVTITVILESVVPRARIYLAGRNARTDRSHSAPSLAVASQSSATEPSIKLSQECLNLIPGHAIPRNRSVCSSPFPFRNNTRLHERILIAYFNICACAYNLFAVKSGHI